MPVSLYKSLHSKCPSSTITNNAVCLLDYNKKEIKQHVSVRFKSTVKRVHFYVVPDRLKPIVGVSDALALGLTSFHCPIYNDWQSTHTHDLKNSVDSIYPNTSPTLHASKVNSTHQDFTLGKLTKETMVNHPKYSKLFTGIGRFKCKLVHITMRQNGTPVHQ